MKKYRLLKDFARHRRGTIVETHFSDGWVYFGTDPRDYPEWFEEVKDKEYTEDDMIEFAHFLQTGGCLKDETIKFWRYQLDKWKELKK